MKSYLRSAMAGAAGAAATILVMWLLALPAVIRFADDHAGLAGWVQAVGAVLALAALFVAQRLDHKHAKNQRLEDAVEASKRSARASITAAKFLTAAIAALANVQDEVESDKWTAGRIALLHADLSAAVSSVRDLDRGSLPNESAVVALVNLLQAGHAAEVLLLYLTKQLEEGKDAPMPPFQSVREGAEASLKQLANAWISAGVVTL